MKPLVRFLAMLYPRRWRQRYGAEFDALIEDTNTNTRTAVNVFVGAISMQIRTWNVATILAVAGFAGLLFAGGIALRLPKRFTSVSVVIIWPPEPVSQELPPDYVKTMASEIESPQTLARIIQTMDLYPRERAQASIEEVTSRMRNEIQIRPIRFTEPDATGGFVVQFSYSDPALAQRVTQDLMARFIDLNVRKLSPERIGLKVLDPASLPRRSSFPNTGGIALVGLAGGLMLGGAFAFFLCRTGLRAA
jgi:uncharacterized protein involved in exopolysaccharide biosynthesis